MSINQAADEPEEKNELTCWQKYDRWIWNSNHFTREEKVTNILKGNRLVNDNVMLVARMNTDATITRNYI